MNKIVLTLACISISAVVTIYVGSLTKPRDHLTKAPPLAGHFSVVVFIGGSADENSVETFIWRVKRLPGVAYDMNSLEIHHLFWGRTKIRLNRLQGSVAPNDLRKEIDRFIQSERLGHLVRVEFNEANTTEIWVE